LSAFDGVDMQALRRKSLALADLFIARVEALGPDSGLTLASPRDAAGRGSHVSFAHADGYSLMQQLIGRGVIGDFRAPDLLRFGFTPLYLRHVDIWDAVEALREELALWRREGPRRVARLAVT
jgi:kynureninase